jgi:hypothetical protein
MRAALVVGGQDRFIQTRIVPRLAAHGLDVVASWPVDKEPRDTLPQVDAVYFVTDMMSHRHNDKVKAMAQRAGIPIIMGLQKWSVTRQRLIDAGFPPVEEANIGAAVNEDEPEVTLHTYVTETALPQAEYANAKLFTRANLPSGFHRGIVVRTRDYPDDREPRTAWLVQMQEGPAAPTSRGTIHFLELSFALRDIDTVADILRHAKVDVPANMSIYDSIAIDDMPVYMQQVSGKLTFLSESQWKLKSARQRRASHAQGTTPPSAPTGGLPLPPLPAPPPEPEDDMHYQPAYDCISEYREAAPSVRSLAVRSLPLLASDPFRTLESLASHMGISSSQTHNGIALARKMLALKGLKYFFNVIQYENFAARCRMFGIEPVSMERANLSPYAKAPSTTPVEPEAPTEPVTHPNPIVEATMTATPVAAITAPTVAPAPTQPSPVAPSPAAAAVTGNPKDELSEFKTMLAMLREEMKRVGIESVTLGPKGANFRRVVVVEDNFDV